ncbi:DUF192 domain-containing protein [bacterium]|nr:DUF192 domain-containing protein [bacterium]
MKIIKKLLYLSFFLLLMSFSYQQKSVKINKIDIVAEIADDDEKRGFGLMYRDSLCENCGMLFIFDEIDFHYFWMKNTLIPLDMIFIDEEYKVVGIVKKAEPQTLISRFVKTPSKYVLEVNGGFCEKNGISVGDLVSWE